MCQARPHPTLSLTLIVVGGPRSEGQEATAACQPQNTASSFSGLVAYRDPGFQFHGHTRSPLGLNTSLSVERVRRPLFSRLFHEYRSWGPLADPHSVASAGVRPQCGSKTILPSTRNNKKQCCQRHMPLPPPNHRDSGWQFPLAAGRSHDLPHTRPSKTQAGPGNIPNSVVVWRFQRPWLMAPSSLHGFRVTKSRSLSACLPSHNPKVTLGLRGSRTAHSLGPLAVSCLPRR